MLLVRNDPADKVLYLDVFLREIQHRKGGL